MRSCEVVARSLEEAKSLAAQELGVAEEDLSIEVIEGPKKVLGLWGSGEFRVRATTHLPQKPQAPALAAVTDESPAPPELNEEELQRESTEAEVGPAPEPTAEQTFAERALDTMGKMLELMGVNAQPQLEAETAEEVRIVIVGPDAGQLIGHHGATLNALQLLLAAIVCKRCASKRRILLDAEGYRERRAQMLQRMARSHAAKAKQARKEIVITDLLPYERRIIHLALKDDPDVGTYSEGEGDDRHLVISPKI